MLIDDALNLLSRLRLLKITSHSAHVYPRHLNLGRIAVRRKRGEALAAMILRLAAKAEPFDRELSMAEIALLYDRLEPNQPTQ